MEMPLQNWDWPGSLQRLQICPLYIFGNYPPQMVHKDLDIGETRVWRLDSGPNLQPCVQTSSHFISLEQQEIDELSCFSWGCMTKFWEHPATAGWSWLAERGILWLPEQGQGDMLLFLENLSRKLWVLHIQINLFGEKQRNILHGSMLLLMLIPLVCTRFIYIHSVAMNHQVCLGLQADGNLPNVGGQDVWLRWLVETTQKRISSLARGGLELVNWPEMTQSFNDFRCKISSMSPPETARKRQWHPGREVLQGVCWNTVI